MSKPHYECSLVACARWEESHIIEWVEYHKQIGFDHIYLYSNDDDPAVLYNILLPYLLGYHPFITYRHFPYLGRQAEIYIHFLRNYKDEVEWFCFLDVDEFITIPQSHNIRKFLTLFSAEWDCIYLHWLLFGHNGLVTRQTGSVLLTYTRRASSIDPHTKCIVRASAIDASALRSRIPTIKQPFWHFANLLGSKDIRVCNVLGENAAAYSEGWPANGEEFARRESITELIISRGYICHFIFKSEHDFFRRESRSTVGAFAGQQRWVSLVREGGHLKLLARLNAVSDTLLAEYWRNRLSRIEPVRIVPEPIGLNLSLGKPAHQSSIYEGLGPTGGNNGLKTGRAGFHTELELAPWWMVDLLMICSIMEVRVYNRIDDPGCADRATNLEISLSVDNKTWTNIHMRDSSFGGIDGNPLVVQINPPMQAKLVRVSLVDANFLHLDEVEVFGKYPE